MDACKEVRDGGVFSSFSLMTERRKKPLASAVHTALEVYLRDLDGNHPGNLYEVVMAEVERPLIEITLRHAGGNLTRAAEILGINRATLRKKLAQHSLL